MKDEAWARSAKTSSEKGGLAGFHSVRASIFFENSPQKIFSPSHISRQGSSEIWSKESKLE